MEKESAINYFLRPTNKPTTNIRNPTIAEEKKAGKEGMTIEGTIAKVDPSANKLHVTTKETKKDKAPPRREGGKPRTVQFLDRFDIDYGLCMYCGICVEVCPFDALFWSPEFEYSELNIAELMHDKKRLGEWMVTVGDGLMVASSICWMFKNLSINDWALYLEHNGSPGLRA